MKMDSVVSCHRLGLVLLILNLTSALLFVALVNRPVFDDPYNFPDAQRYAAEGVSASSIERHVNPTGPSSFIWMAGAIRLFGSDELRDARLAVVISWLILGVGVLAGIRYAGSAESWGYGLVAALVFPHTMTATATLRTEGPAMMFAVLGLQAWMGSADTAATGARRPAAGILGGLAAGIAVTCRQYYLAILPAAALVGLYRWRTEHPGAAAKSLINTALFLAAALVPIGLLVWVWKGLSSPGMVSGASYGALTSSVGLSLSRPVIAAFYTALYLVPLTLPVLLGRRFPRRRWAVAIAVAGGAAGALMTSLVQPGPLASLLSFAGAIPGGRVLFFGVVMALVIYNAAALLAVAWEERQRITAQPPVLLAALMLCFFIAEQAGVGGSIPFYEVYVLQMAPFIGMLAFGLLPGLPTPRLLSLVLLSLSSHALLWRHALNG